MYRLIQQKFGADFPIFKEDFAKFEDAQSQLKYHLINLCEEHAIYGDEDPEYYSGEGALQELIETLQRAKENKDFDYWSYDNYYWKVYKTPFEISKFKKSIIESVINDNRDSILIDYGGDVSRYLSFIIKFTDNGYTDFLSDEQIEFYENLTGANKNEYFYEIIAKINSEYNYKLTN
jgi:hypothetical protein